MVNNKIKFFRRRQFVLGPKYINYEGWNRLKIDEKYLLTFHPDLPVNIAEKNEKKAILIGYVIDPYNSELNDEDILGRFVDRINSINDISEQLKILTGRFVLIIKNNDNMLLFHDFCALRQVNFCFDSNGSIWCASQPGILAEYLGFKLDQEMISYLNMPAFKLGKEEFWFINDRTPYSEIKYLLPNHYLDLKRGSVTRYWPNPGCIGSISIEECISLCKKILENSIKKAAEKFTLKMGISAGCDSRRSLAAAKEVKDKIIFFTHTPEVYKETDIEIPSCLLPKLGIKHHVLHIEKMSEEFRNYYESNVTWAREKHGHIAYTALKYFGPDITVLNSNISEISQVYYWLPKSKINGKGLAIATRLNHQLVINEFEKWVKETKQICEKANMNILVLFDLEQRSRWISQAINEYDIAYETFNPYNNRKLFEIELSVPEKYRKGRRLDFHIKQIKNMWPEVLMLPINPERRILRKIKKFILNSIINKTVTPWIPLIEYLRYLKLKKEFRRNEK